MAQVAADVHAKIEHALDYLLDEWTDVPGVAAEWPNLERPERMDFVLEWPIRESHLTRLREYAARGMFTPGQQARYETLLKLVERHRPTLERLLKG